CSHLFGSPTNFSKQSKVCVCCLVCVFPSAVLRLFFTLVHLHRLSHKYTHTHTHTHTHTRTHRGPHGNAFPLSAQATSRFFFHLFFFSPPGGTGLLPSHQLSKAAAVALKV